MMKKTFARFSSIAATSVGALVLTASKVSAQVNTNYAGVSDSLGDKDLRETVQDGIKVFLSVLALVAVVLILVGGFRWMTAGGNQEKVESAKKTLVAALIGLVIIFAAWAIVLFAFSQIGEATDTAV